MSATTTTTAKKGSTTATPLAPTLQAMRAEQKALAAKIAELEADANEHALVTEALEGVADGRKCFQMVGGVLHETRVEHVLPTLRTNRQMMTSVATQLKRQFESRAQEIADLHSKQ